MSATTPAAASGRKHLPPLQNARSRHSRPPIIGLLSRPSAVLLSLRFRVLRVRVRVRLLRVATSRQCINRRHHCYRAVAQIVELLEGLPGPVVSASSRRSAISAWPGTESRRGLQARPAARLRVLPGPADCSTCICKLVLYNKVYNIVKYEKYGQIW